MRFIETNSTLGNHLFGFPTEIDHTLFLDAMSTIRHGNERYWERVKKTLVEHYDAFGASVSNMKYVVTNSDEYGEQLFMFPKTIDHDRFAEALNHIDEQVHVYRQPVSAGFVDGGVCSGRSETLDLDSRKSDSLLIT